MDGSADLNGVRVNWRVYNPLNLILRFAMARLPRLVVPHQPHLVLQQGIDRQPVFRDAEDHAVFLAWMREAARQFKVAIHAFALLPDRIHLLVTPGDEPGLGRMMQWIGRHYVPYFNRKYGRAGTLWQGRFKATVVDPDRYFMICCRYVELQPAFDNLTSNPADYLWSSCAHHIGIRSEPSVTDHRAYWSLGNTPFEREAAYRLQLEQALTSDEIRAVRESQAKGWALGSDQFKALLEKSTRRRVSPAKRGRPAIKGPIAT
jgi:putative transposase